MNDSFNAGFSRRQEELQKEAAIAAIGRGLLTAGKTLWKHKGKALTAGFAAMDIGSGARQGAEAAAKGVNTGTFNVSRAAQF